MLDEDGRRPDEWAFNRYNMWLIDTLAARWCFERRGIPVPEHLRAHHTGDRTRLLKPEIAAAFDSWRQNDDGSYSSIAAYVEEMILPVRGIPSLIAALSDSECISPLGLTLRTALASHDLIAEADGQSSAMAYLVHLAIRNPDAQLWGERAAASQYDDLLQTYFDELVHLGRLNEAANLLEHKCSQQFSTDDREPDPDRWHALAELNHRLGNRPGEGVALRRRLSELRKKYDWSDESYDAEADLRQVMAVLNRGPSDELCRTLWELADHLLDDPHRITECVETTARARAMDESLMTASGRESSLDTYDFTHRVVDRWLIAHHGDWPAEPEEYAQLYRASGGFNLADAHLFCADRHEWKHHCAFLDGRDRHLGAARELFGRTGNQRGLVDVAYAQAVLGGRISFAFIGDGNLDAHANPQTLRPAEEILLECRTWYLQNDDQFRAAECLHVLADWDQHAQRTEDAKVKYQQALDEYVADGHGDSHFADLCRKRLSKPEDSQENSSAPTHDEHELADWERDLLGDNAPGREDGHYGARDPS